MGGCCQSQSDHSLQANIVPQGKGKALSYEELLSKYAKAGQDHVLKYYNDISADEQHSLLTQLSQMDPNMINYLYYQLVKEAKEEEEAGVVEPLDDSFTKVKADMTLEEAKELQEVGLTKIREGKVCFLILAGGQGTRLGFDGPKGLYNIGLPSQKTLFQIFTEKFLRIQKLAHNEGSDFQKCKMLIMTSKINHDVTVNFFQENNYFGANKENIVFFSQSVLPAVDTEGRILLSSQSEVVMAPNGNGALFEAINNNQEVQNTLKSCEYVQLGSVDNPILKVMDPLFIGFACQNNFSAAIKSCLKAHAHEQAGVLAKKDGKYEIVEYSEIGSRAEEQNSSGELNFRYINILIFLLQTKKLLELCSQTETMNQLYHKAFKKIPYFDENQECVVKPQSPNGYKFELFIHSFLNFCEDGEVGILQVTREQEFAPVKNAEGSATDSPNTARDLIYQEARSWLGQYDSVELIENEDPAVEVDFLQSSFGENLGPLVEGKAISTPAYIH